ncbi:hypothetical protein [Nocardia africana]
MSARIDPCGICGSVHPLGDHLTLIRQYKHEIKQLIEIGKPVDEFLDDLELIARCLHSQLHAAHADMHNYALTIRELQAENAHVRHIPGGRVDESGTKFAVRRRDGKIIESPAPDLAVSRFDNMNTQALELGFESADAEVVRRDWAIYVEDWTALSPEEIEQYRVDHWDEPPF